MRQGDRASCVRLDRKEAVTRPPARFTEGTLGKAMENIHRLVESGIAQGAKLVVDGRGLQVEGRQAVPEHLLPAGRVQRRDGRLLGRHWTRAGARETTR